MMLRKCYGSSLIFIVALTSALILISTNANAMRDDSGGNQEGTSQTLEPVNITTFSKTDSPGSEQACCLPKKKNDY